jgi:hypothetical protein
MRVVNLFAGPGAGKSTTAAALFAALKQRGICAELVTEFAKDCAWEGREGPLRCQPYVFGEQLWRLERLRGRGIEVVVTDSPILLSAVYRPPGTPDALREVVWHYHNAFDNVNVHVRRAKPYDERGRFQSEDEARELDGRIVETVLHGGDRFHVVTPGDAGAASRVLDYLMENPR